MRREEPHRSTVGWMERSAVGVRLHLDCGHMHVVVLEEAFRVPPLGIGSETACGQCPPDVFDDMAMFDDLRGRL